MKTSLLGQQVMRHYETYHDGDLSKIDLQPKECPAGIWTVGLGHALYDLDGSPLKGADGYPKIAKLFPQFVNMSKEQADILFAQDLKKFETFVNRKLKRSISQQQYDALVSFVFNCGFSETLFMLINDQVQDMDRICEFWGTHYITVHGAVKRGLIYRRKTELTLFRDGNVQFFN